MKFTISNEQRLYFKENGLIEFSDVLTEKQLQGLTSAINSVIQDENPTSSFASGRDMWRKNETIKRITLKKQFAEIVADLTDSSLVRIAFDQYIPHDYHSVVYQNPSKIEPSFCFKDLLALLIFRLDAKTATQQEEKFLLDSCNALFLSPTRDVNWEEELENCSYFMIGYGNKETKYRLNENDPCTYELKHMGYSIGSYLKNTVHPPLYPTG